MDKNMKTAAVSPRWGWRSLSYWMTLFIALGILIIGFRFMLMPETSIEDFGLKVSSASEHALGRVKGIRDIFSGIALLCLLLARMKRASAYVFTAAIIIPFTDCLLVYLQNGVDLPRLLVHGLTGVYMVITSFLLFRNPTNAAA